MTVSRIIVNLVLTAAGLAVGYVTGGGRAAPEAARTAKKPSSACPISAHERELSAKIRELEAMYNAVPEPEKPEVEADERFWKPFATTNEDGTVTFAVSLLGGFAFDLKKQMEELRETDPEEFGRRAAFRRKMGDQIADGYDRCICFFEQVDDSWMNADDRASFGLFVDKLKTASDVARRGGRWDLPFEQRKQVDAYSFRVLPTIPNEYPKVRSLFLKRTTELMGLDGEQADDFIATVNMIERMTSRYTAVSL